MKTTTNIRNIAIVVLLSMITITAFSQNTIRQNRRDNDNRRGSEVTERKKQDSYRQNSAKDYESNKRSDYNNRGVKKGNDNDNRSRYINGDDKNHKDKHYNRPNNDHNRRHPVHVSHKKSHHPVYYRHLPERRANRFYYKGFDYYHVNNSFYRYHPAHGYYIVDTPFTYVRHLPPGFFVRYYNGNHYYFANGFLYLPFERGFLMVPQPERPMISLNILLN